MGLVCLADGGGGGGGLCGGRPLGLVWLADGPIVAGVAGGLCGWCGWRGVFCDTLRQGPVRSVRYVAKQSAIQSVRFAIHSGLR